MNTSNIKTHNYDSFLKFGDDASCAQPGAVNCEWGEWSIWSECAGKCGEPGSQMRHRKKIKEKE